MSSEAGDVLKGVSSSKWRHRSFNHKILWCIGRQVFTYLAKIVLDFYFFLHRQIETIKFGISIWINPTTSQP